MLNPSYRCGLTPLEIAAPYYANVQSLDEVHKKQYLDLHLWMPADINLKADKMCMAHSLELRVPYLDREVAAVASRIPSRYLVRGTESKAVFRAAANMALPDEWATRPKKGFPVPIRNWLREEKYAAVVRGYFESNAAAEFFNPAEILTLLADHQSGKKNNARKIWVIYTFLTWYKRFFIDETTPTQTEVD